MSPWHLVLLPVALVMVLPLLWMIVTSPETLDETRHYPPTLIPDSLGLNNYTQVLRDAVRPVVPEHADRHRLRGGGTCFLQPGRLRVRADQVLRHEVALVLILATLMVPFQVIVIPSS